MRGFCIYSKNKEQRNLRSEPEEGRALCSAGGTWGGSAAWPVGRPAVLCNDGVTA